MALDPVVNQLREIAISGSATLADIPFLAQRLKQEQTGQFGQTAPGLESDAQGRGGGSGLGTGLFEPPPAGDILAGGGGGGFSGVSSLESFADAFTGAAPANFGGRGGPDSEGGGQVGISTADFSPTSEIGLALSAFGALTGIPAGSISNALSNTLSRFGVLGASRPTVGTQGFRDITDATQAARDLENDVGRIEGVIGRELTPAELKGFEQAVNDRLSGGAGDTEGGTGTGGGGVAGGPGTGAGPGGSGPGNPDTGPPGTGPASPPSGRSAAEGGGRGGSSDGGGGGPSGPGGSGGGSGPGGPGGGAGEGRHVGGIVSEDERPGITAGDVPNQLLQEGEFIVRREAVQNLGEPFMDALNTLAANFDPKKTRNALRELLK